MIQKNVKTNLMQGEMFSIQKNYKNTRNNIEQVQMDGEGKIIDKI